MEALKNVKIDPKIHARLLEYCKKGRVVKLNMGDYAGQAILEKIERDEGELERLYQEKMREKCYE